MTATPPSARPGINVASTLVHAARIHGDREAVVDGADRLTYAELGREVAGLASGLLQLGLEPGAVVGVLSLNSRRHLAAWLAVPHAGLVLNELNTRLAVAELEFIVTDSETRVLVVDATHLETGRELLRRCPTVRHLVLAEPEVDSDALSFDELASAAPMWPAETTTDDIAGIFYTGGTTGRPKGVMLTHGNLLANARTVLLCFQLDSSARFLHAGPMFHLADGMLTFSVTWVGGTHAIVPSFEAAAVARVIEAERITVTTLVPTMINLLVNDPALERHDLSSLDRILYGGAPMPSAVRERATRVLGCDLTQVYGMTEAAPLATYCLIEGPTDQEPWATRARSAGRACLGVEVTVRDPDGELCAVDEVGEVWLRGPNIMAGYWQRPEETAAALTPDGWYRSGDAARLDADGYLYIVDRLKDMIVSGGENVYGAEVESALSSHPAVLEVAVFGIPHETWGEAVHAEIVLREGATATEPELIEHCRGLLAGYKTPRSLSLRTELLPKSGAGKVLKRELRAPYWAGRESEIV